MADPTIAAGYPRAFADFAVSLGAERAALLARAGLTEAALDDPDDRVSVARYVALMEAAADLAGEPAIALKFGEAVRMQDISIVGLICEACETTIEVGAQLNRYAALVVDDERGEPATLMRAVPGDDGIWVEGPSDLFTNNPLIAEAEFARLVWNARVMFADSEVFQKLKFPRVIHFRHVAPSYRAEHKRVFAAPVVFESHWNAMLIDPEFLTLKQPPVNRYVFGVLSEKAEALLKSREASRTTRGRVESLIMPILHTGEASIERIATAMGLSRQSLYRQLKAEGVTFAEVLDALRRELAARFLGDRNVSVNETAYLLGFSDPASFSRAFKRWNGVSPRAARGGGPKRL